MHWNHNLNLMLRKRLFRENLVDWNLLHGIVFCTFARYLDWKSVKEQRLTYVWVLHRTFFHKFYKVIMRMTT